MNYLPRIILALVAASALALPPVATARQGGVVKHTVSGSGIFEQGRGMRAEVNRATFHPIDQHFALSVSGRMGWVITGQWERDGDEIILRVSNMNNTPARGSGEVKLDSRGNVDTVKLSGTSRGGAYKVKFKAGAPGPVSPPSVRLGPGSEPTPKPSVLEPFSQEAFDRSRRGRGAMKLAGGMTVSVVSADVQMTPSGRVSVRATTAGNTYRFDGTAGSSASREELDLVLHAVGNESGVVTGTARMDRSGQAVDELELRGWLHGQPFLLDFKAGR